MKKILGYVKDFYAQQSKIYLLLVVLFISTLIYFNYNHGLETKYVGGNSSWTGNFIGYFLMYASALIIPFLLQWLFYPGAKQWRAAWLGIILVLGPAIFSMRVNFHHFYENVEDLQSKSYYDAFDLCLKTIITLFPIYLVWRFKEKDQSPFYGFKTLKDYNPYWTMLLIMVPLIALASTQYDFLQKYPRAMVLPGLPVESPKEAVSLLVYELSYGFNFLSIEVFFRGFLILALMKYCGTKCIIPVACFYVVIHFGKPMGEAISSFFGGILLGIITYHTRSIWGGLIAHVGIAWLMELGGFIGNYVTEKS